MGGAFGCGWSEEDRECSGQLDRDEAAHLIRERILSKAVLADEITKKDPSHSSPRRDMILDKLKLRGPH